MPARRFRLHGRVQGVGFRWWARSQASQLGLAGSVRNEEDGTVVVHASGPEESLASLRAALAEGPRAARVDRIDEEDEAEDVVPATGGEFRIEH